MILYLDDWKKYPNAIPHYTTMNKSWVRFCGLLDKMGLKNNLFPLALHNPALEFVDAHSPDLTNEQIRDIIIEAKTNPWYAIREVLRTPHGSAIEPGYIFANRSLMCTFWIYNQGIVLYKIQSRQTGKSFADIEVKGTYNLFIRGQNMRLSVLTQSENLKKKTIDKLKGMRDSLPYYLKLNNRHDADNQESMTCHALGNKLSIYLSNTSKELADKSGRGITTEDIVGDEVAFIPNIDIFLASAVPGYGTASEIAKRNGTPYGISYCTTAGRINTPSGKFIHDIVMSNAFFTEMMYDLKNREELIEVIKSNSKNNSLSVTAIFNYKQLGKTDEWAKNIINAANLSKDRINSELNNVWTGLADDSPFSDEQREKISLSVKPPVKTDIKNNYLINWYIPEEELNFRLNNSDFIIGLDTSDAQGSDAISLFILDVRTCECVGAGNFNNINIATFCSFLGDLLLTYDKFVIIPERRSTGGAIIDALCLILHTNGINPFKRIFNWVVSGDITSQNTIRENISNATMETLNKNKKLFGFATSGSGQTSRGLLYSNVITQALEIGGSFLYDRVVVDQLLNLTFRNGRIDHPVGGHDDAVISMLLSYWFLLYGKNLSNYGIDVSKLRSQIPNMNIKEDLRTKYDVYESDRQQNIKNKIMALIDDINREKDEILSEKLLSDLSRLQKELVADYSVIKTFSELIENVKLTSRKKFSQKHIKSRKSVAHLFL